MGCPGRHNVKIPSCSGNMMSDVVVFVGNYSSPGYRIFILTTPGTHEMRDPDAGKADEVRQDNVGAAADKEENSGQLTDVGAQEAASELSYAMKGFADNAAAGQCERGPGFRPGV